MNARQNFRPLPRKMTKGNLMSATLRAKFHQEGIKLAEDCQLFSSPGRKDNEPDYRTQLIYIFVQVVNIFQTVKSEAIFLMSL